LSLQKVTHGISEFLFILECLTELFGKFDQNDPDTCSQGETLGIREIVDSLTQGSMKENKRIMTVNEKSKRKGTLLFSCRY
jgi:hypothetical protein